VVAGEKEEVTDHLHHSAPYENLWSMQAHHRIAVLEGHNRLGNA
jgi:hypothetical protein